MYEVYLCITGFNFNAPWSILANQTSIVLILSKSYLCYHEGKGKIPALQDGQYMCRCRL